MFLLVVEEDVRSAGAEERSLRVPSDEMYLVGGRSPSSKRVNVTLVRRRVPGRDNREPDTAGPIISHEGLSDHRKLWKKGPPKWASVHRHMRVLAFMRKEPFQTVVSENPVRRCVFR